MTHTMQNFGTSRTLFYTACLGVYGRTTQFLPAPTDIEIYVYRNQTRLYDAQSFYMRVSSGKEEPLLFFFIISGRN